MRLIDADALNGYKFGLISPYAQNLFHETINEAPTIDYKQLLEQEPCEMTGEEYRQRMIQAFHNADCDELIAICVLPTEKEFEHLEWLLEKHYKAKPELCADAISREELLKAIDTWDKFGYTETGCFVREPKGDYVPYIHYDDVIKSIKGMPPVTPAQKDGGEE